MRPNTSHSILVLTLIIVVVITLSSQPTAQSSASQNTTPNSTSPNSTSTNASQTDTTPPTVTSITPIGGATGVVVGSPITATFSEAVQSNTVNGTTFTVKNSAGTSIPGMVTYDSTAKIASLKPSAALAYSMTYAATLTNGIKDIAGNTLASSSWSFTTAAQTATACILQPNATTATDKWLFAVVAPVAGLIILAVTFAASRIIRKGKQWLLAQGQLVLEANCKQGNYRGGFWDIIREGDYFPSLARLQFVLWTFTISFTLLSIYLLMLWNNTLCWSELPQNILALLGISAGVPIVSTVISREKYMSSIRGSLPCKENVPSLSTMLLEHSKPTIGRYQLFIWTIISIIVYLGIFFIQISGISNTEQLAQLELADIPLPLLGLMGISQVAYLGLKAVARPVSFLTIVGSVPAPNQKNIMRSRNIVVNFSEPLDSTTVNNLSFVVMKHSDKTNVAGTVSVPAEDDKMAIFDPSTELEASTTYDVHILPTIQSKDKKSLEREETWSFETGS